MSSRYAPLIITLTVVAITAGGLFLAARSRGRKAPSAVAQPQPPKPEALPEVKVQGAELEDRGPDGQLRWKVRAGGAFQYDKDRELFMGKDVSFAVIQRGKTPVTVTAPHFTADYPAKKLTFEQGVKGQIAGGGGSFQVARLEYQFDTRKLIGGGGARFEKGGYTATAETLVVDPVREKVRLGGGVRFRAGG